jgi:hypothetical protein
MRDRRTHLKIKIKNLADEARAIRREEQKAKKHARDLAKKHGGPIRDTYLRQSLWEHRCGPSDGIVRREARHSLLAYAFIRGLEYERVERKPKPFDVDKVRAMIERFGPRLDWQGGESDGEFKCRLQDYKARTAVWLANAAKYTEQAA